MGAKRFLAFVLLGVAGQLGFGLEASAQTSQTVFLPSDVVVLAAPVPDSPMGVTLGPSRSNQSASGCFTDKPIQRFAVIHQSGQIAAQITEVVNNNAALGPGSRCVFETPGTLCAEGEWTQYSATCD